MWRTLSKTSSWPTWVDNEDNIPIYSSKVKRKTWKGIMIRNVLTRRREYGTYLATARRHRRRLKMQKRDE